MKNWLILFLSIFITEQLEAQINNKFYQKALQFHIAQNDSAFYYFDKAIKMAKDEEEAWTIAINKCNCYNGLDKIKEGEIYCRNLYDSLYQRLTPEKRIALVVAVGYIYARAEKFDQQLFMANLSLEEANKLNNNYFLAVAHQTLFLGYHNLKMDSKKVVHGKKAMNYALSSNNNYHIHEVAFYFFSYLRDSITFEPYASYLTQYLERTSPEILPFDGHHAGFEYLDEFKISIPEWEDLLIKSQQRKDLSAELRVAFKLIQENRAVGDNDAALYHLDQIIPKAKAAGENLILQNFYYEQQEIYQELNQTRKAIQAYEKYHALRDSLQGVDVLKNLDSLTIAFETSKKDRLIADQQITILQSEKRRNILIGIIGLVLASAGIIYYNQKKKFRLKEQIIKKEKLIQEQKLQALKQNNKIKSLNLINQGENRERKRIASELHDSLGALLTSARLKLSRITEKSDIKPAENALLEAKTILDQASSEVRKISHALMPDALVHMGLSEAIEDLAGTINDSGKISVKTHFFSIDNEVFSDIEKINIYRIVQEITNNALKHSFASEMIIQLSREDDHYALILEDNGIGFDPEYAKSKGGLGLTNLQNRVQVLDGSMNIVSASGGPTSFTIRWPLANI